MAIGNVTPDSFYAASRLLSPSSDSIDREVLLAWAEQSLADGASILDIGACSTRPGSTPASPEEEWRRLAPALTILREEMPEVSLSVDTFRPGIARRALEQFGPLIINDVSSGCPEMMETVRQWKAPYIWTLRGRLDLPAAHPEYDDIDLILDPGFGFIGSVKADYECMRHLDDLRRFHRQILVGVSRKSMVWKPLGLTPDSCLSATQALQLYALEHGATILRTHDVAATSQTIRLWQQLND